jgi:hypothetical protein
MSLDYFKNIFNQLKKEVDELGPQASAIDPNFTAKPSGEIWSDIFMSYNVDRVPQKLEEKGEIDKAKAWYSTKIKEILKAYPYLDNNKIYDAKKFVKGLGIKTYSFKKRQIHIRR